MQSTRNPEDNHTPVLASVFLHHYGPHWGCRRTAAPTLCTLAFSLRAPYHACRHLVEHSSAEKPTAVCVNPKFTMRIKPLLRTSNKRQTVGLLSGGTPLHAKSLKMSDQEQNRRQHNFIVNARTPAHYCGTYPNPQPPLQESSGISRRVQSPTIATEASRIYWGHHQLHRFLSAYRLNEPTQVDIAHEWLNIS